MVTYEYLLRKFYGRYKWQWCKERGCKPEDVDEEIGINGECFVCIEEFEDNEYQDREFMRHLLCDEEFDWWEIRDKLKNDDDSVTLDTFPDDDRNFSKKFTVPKSWLIDLLEKMDALNERKGVDLDQFLQNYIWDETWFIYLQAKQCEVISEERECEDESVG